MFVMQHHLARSVVKKIQIMEEHAIFFLIYIYSQGHMIIYNVVMWAKQQNKFVHNIIP
jgi:hypothetical protein